MIDTNTDETVSYLNSVKDEFNILEVLEYEKDENSVAIETNEKQILFDAAFKYSNKLIYLDADEYLDGNMTKNEVEILLDNNPDTLLMAE